MRTRCPVCITVFRVTTEQLRLRAGKVRCGHCQAVFNAFDELVSDENEPLIEASVAEGATPHDEAASPKFEVPEAESIPEPEPEPTVALWSADSPIDADEVPLVELPISEVNEHTGVPADDAEAERFPAIITEPLEEPVGEEPIADKAELVEAPQEAPLDESPEESTQAARQAGLVAARELIDSGAFNRWSAGTLAGDGLGGFENEPNHRAVWHFVLVAAFLLVGLVGQLLYYFRTDVVLRFPDAAGMYDLVAVDIPLPRNAALVSIEASDLQSDNVRGLFVLQATLKNRAAHAQAWPALELSLTDTNDAVVSRRVMFAADYLPPGTTADAFAANGEMPVKLWIEAKETGASGYRLYIFYP